MASEEFKPGAAAQAKALGFGPAMVWVPHPIQNRTPEELAELANQSVERVLTLISR